jgi:hypothetical protein
VLTITSQYRLLVNSTTANKTHKTLEKVLFPVWASDWHQALAGQNIRFRDLGNFFFREGKKNDLS